MAFAYYQKLNRKERRIDDASEAVSAVRLDVPARLRPLVHHVVSALASGDRIAVERTSRALMPPRLSL